MAVQPISSRAMGEMLKFLMVSLLFSFEIRNADH